MPDRTVRAATVTRIGGGISTPAGFRAAGVACGIKKGLPDLALIVADRPASAAGLFTTSRVQAAPVSVSREHLELSGGLASAIVVNSGCANACTGEQGAMDARAMAARSAAILQCPVEQVLVASTGVIGVALDIEKITAALPRAVSALSRDGHSAAKAIMTTDRWPKEAAVRVETTGGTFHVGGMAKGSGMIEPHLATMLAFLTTDARVEPAALSKALSDAVDDTFNAITVDGECSTNDTVLALAGGASGISIEGDELNSALATGLRAVSRALALEIVRGGEGATKLVSVQVVGARSSEDARRAARTIANSLLVKTAVHGGDPNWGRLVAAAGRAGADLELDRASVSIGPVVLFERGRPFDERAADAAEYLAGTEIDLRLDLGTGGPHEATVWTCDLSAEYVRINAEYRT